MYTIPYMGSKRRFASSIIGIMPPAEVFVDLFSGSGTMTTAALLSGKYRRAITNDIKGMAHLYIDALNGKFRHEDFRFVSKAEFHKVKRTDLVAAICYSFSGDSHSYFHAESREDVVRYCAEYYRLHGKPLSYNDTYKGELVRAANRASSKYNALCKMAAHKSLAPRIAASSLDYRAVTIPKDSVVYCDPPYENTQGYGVAFDSSAFWEWARACPSPLYVSSYNAPPDFVPLIEISVTDTFNAHKKNNYPKHERVFVHESRIEEHKKASGFFL